MAAQTTLNPLAHPTGVQHLPRETGTGSNIPSISLSDPESTILSITRAAAHSHGILLTRSDSLTTVPPFARIKSLFDLLSTNAPLANALNATYPTRGVYKIAALANPTSDQKLTVDLSRTRLSRIPTDLRTKLGPDFEATVSFFEAMHTTLVPLLLQATSDIVGTDLAPLHAAENVNYRLCDYGALTAAPESTNGCGSHRDYGTVSVIFQDGHSGLEVRNAVTGKWEAVPGDAVVMLWGWCATILSGDRVRAVEHRVRRTPGVRRNTAVLFVAPDTDVALKPLGGDMGSFGERVRAGEVSVEMFKEEMGKRWRWREGNEAFSEDLREGGTQDEDIRAFLRG
jgi:hypothetical protein